MSLLALSIRFLQTQPDERLLYLARNGHERAFEALIRRYRRALLGYCHRMCATSGASGEDVLQQALLQAWVAIRTSETDVRDVRAWLYRIVHNVAVSQLRRPAHEPVRALVTPVLGTPGSPGADQELEERLQVREALAGLAALPDLQREVMMSAALDGRSHDEIATSLGLSHGAVRGLIYRARATLRAAAAALVPGPLVNWAARQGTGGSAGVLEAAVGGGSAGLGATLLKGGAFVVTVGALATTGGLTQAHHPRHGDRLSIAAAGQGGVARASQLHAGSAGAAGPGISAVRAIRRPGGEGQSQAGPTGGGLLDRHGDHGGQRQLVTGAGAGALSGHDRGGSGSTDGRGGSGDSGGSGGSDGSGGSGGARSDGSASAAIQASSRDSGGDQGGGSDGGGGSSDGGGGSSDGGGGSASGGSSGRDLGSGSDGGSTTTTPVAVTTLLSSSGGH